MLLSQSLLSLAALWVAGVAADANQDLGTVLQNTKNLTKFYDLLKVSPLASLAAGNLWWLGLRYGLTLMSRNTQMCCFNYPALMV